MSIKEKKLTEDQERRYNALIEQMRKEADDIEPWEKSGLNNLEANRPYRELVKKYRPLLDAILDEEAPAPVGEEANV